MKMTKKEAKALFKKLGKAFPTKADGFDSTGEAIYYTQAVQPLLLSGEITSCDLHQEFEIIPKVEFQDKTYRPRKFKPDFFLTYKDGHVKVVEVKSKYVKHAQRDYPLRRQLFFINFCIPNGWEFEEVSADDLTKKGAKNNGKRKRKSSSL